LPKLEVFPTLRPLTAEEQALVAFAEQATPEQKKQVMEAEQHLGDPIAIAELKIRPLDEGEKTDSDKER
jgi:RNA binding exosome subunit